MASRSDLARADDLDAVLIGPWEWPAWLVRWRIPIFLLLTADLALLPLVFGGGPLVFAGVVVGVLVVGVVGLFVVIMEAKSGTRLVGFSARGVFAPDLVPWERVAGVAIGKTSGAGRAVSVEGTDGTRREVAIPKTVAEPEYWAFAAALRAEAASRGVATT